MAPPNAKDIFMILTGKPDKLVPYGPANVLLLEAFNMPVMQQVAALECTKDDIIICSFPKSGTTWTQAIVSMIVQANERDSINPDQSDLKDWLYIEMNAPACKGKTPIEAAKNMPPPRLLRTHLSMEILPQSLLTNKSKIVFVYRKLKDVIVSMYYMYCSFNNLASCHPADSVEAFAELFMQDKVHHAPYFHTFKSLWDHRDDSNLHHLTYEDLQNDANGEIKRLADFLGKPLTEEQIHQIAVHTDFKHMSKNEKLNSSEMTVTDKQTGEKKFEFMRKGEVGGGAKNLSEEVSKKIDTWIDEQAAKYRLDVALFR